MVGVARKLLLCCSLSLAVACQTTPPRLPQMVHTPDEFWSGFPVLCLSAVTSDIDLRDEASARLALVERLLAAELEAHEYEVVPSPAADELWAEIQSSGEGRFDPHTGRVDVAAHDRSRQTYWQALVERLGCSALVSSRLAMVSAGFVNGLAEWDGTSDKVEGAWGESGRVAALSFRVWIHDEDDEDVYFGAGGIETISTFEREFFTTAFELKPAAGMLQDEERVRMAIRIALDELFGSPLHKEAERAREARSRAAKEALDAGR